MKMQNAAFPAIICSSRMFYVIQPSGIPVTRVKKLSVKEEIRSINGEEAGTVCRKGEEAVTSSRGISSYS